MSLPTDDCVPASVPPCSAWPRREVPARILTPRVSDDVRSCARRHGVDPHVVVTAAVTAHLLDVGPDTATATPSDSAHLAPDCTVSELIGHLATGAGDRRVGVTVPRVQVLEGTLGRLRIEVPGLELPGGDRGSRPTGTDDRLDRLIDHLHRFVRSDSIAIGALDVVTAGERARILDEWNATAELIAPATVADLLEMSGARNIDAIAVDGDHPLTYGELDCRANQVARRLLVAGVGTDRVVGVMCADPVASVIAALAVLRCGGAVLPLAVGDDSTAISAAVLAADPICVLTDRVLTDTVLDPDDALARMVAGLDIDVLLDPRSVTRDAGPDGSETLSPTGYDAVPPWVPAVALDPVELEEYPDDPLCPDELIGPARMTSAAIVTVGELDTATNCRRPSVVITHAALANRLMWTTAHTAPADAVAVPAGAMDAEWTCAVLWPLTVGARLTPFAETVDSAPDTDDLWGPPEASGAALAGVPSGGRPGWNTQAYVLDPFLRLAPPGTVGELYLSGVQLARGYADETDSTASHFVANPFRPGERMIRTGRRMACRSDGAIEPVAARVPAPVRDVAAHDPATSTLAGRRSDDDLQDTASRDVA